MLMIVRQQMICIIATGWSGVEDFSVRGTVLALKPLFTDVEVVQFASIALLPAMADAPDQSPSLMLELAIEEGIVRTTCCTGSSIIRAVRCGRSTGRTRPTAACTRELAQRGIARSADERHHVAEGGFVGARDRSVRQIEKEEELLEWTRIAARALKAQSARRGPGVVRARARAMGFRNPEFEWAVEPAPRSYWRGSGASVIAKVG